MAINGVFTVPTSNFTMADNDVLYNPNISREARLIYMFIQGKITNPNSKLYKENLYEFFGGAHQTFDKYWNELKDLGLLLVKKLRDAKNQFYYEYTLLSPSAIKNTTENTACDLTTTCDSQSSAVIDDAQIEAVELNESEMDKDVEACFETQHEKHNVNAETLIKTNATKITSGTYIPQNDFTIFFNQWESFLGERPILTEREMKKLDQLIAEKSYLDVVRAVRHISYSDYLMNHVTIYYFIKYFDDILNDKYMNWNCPYRRPIYKNNN